MYVFNNEISQLVNLTVLDCFSSSVAIYMCV